jgi:hypothetical protein
MRHRDLMTKLYTHGKIRFMDNLALMLVYDTKI